MSTLSGDYNTLLDKIMYNEYEFDDISTQIMTNYLNYGFIQKDVSKDDILKIDKIVSSDGYKFHVKCSSGASVYCYVKKEKKFFETKDLFFDDTPSFSNWLNNEECERWLIENDIYVSIQQTYPEILGSLLFAHSQEIKTEFLREIKNSQTVYQAKVIDKNHGGFIVDIKGVRAFLPGSLAAANKIVDFDKYIGTNINVMLEDYLKDGETFIVSNKKYISKILPSMIKTLEYNTLYEGEITGTKKFGIFLEFNDIMTGLLHTSEMLPETLDKFNNNEFNVGDKIQFYIKELINNTKIILTEDINSSNVSADAQIEDFKNDCEGTVQEGEIINIKTFGSFIKFNYKTKSFVGLYSIKEYPKDFVPILNQKLKLYVNRVFLDTNKIFLKTVREEK